MFLLVGLGNPGSKYANNRHNVGSRIIDAIAKANGGVSSKKIASIAEVSSFCLEKAKIIMAKPLTFMNLSGQAIRFLVDFYKIPLGKVYIFHDDIDLDFGHVKIKKAGGSGGHNGLKSIDSLIGNDYLRIRIGVGRPEEKSMVSSYVLSDFLESEEEILQKILSEISQNIPLLFSDIKLLELQLNDAAKNCC
jgi:PTH1 family peptidyl-tRNA hydrolase